MKENVFSSQYGKIFLKNVLPVNVKLTDHDAVCLFSTESKIKHDSINSMARK